MMANPVMLATTDSIVRGDTNVELVFGILLFTWLGWCSSSRRCSRAS
jgi:hypothetical protein